MSVMLKCVGKKLGQKIVSYGGNVCLLVHKIHWSWKEKASSASAFDWHHKWVTVLCPVVATSHALNLGHGFCHNFTGL